MTRSFAVVAWVGICALAGGTAACGDNGGGEQADAAVQHDVAAQEDAPAGSLRVRIVSGLTVATFTGVAGADVVIDKPGGEREEKQTDADGRVTFTGLDWSLGKAAVTAYKAGSGMPPTSQVAITETAEEVLMYLWAYQLAQPSATLSGTALSLQAATDRLWVTATNSTSYSEGVGATWTMPVWTGVPFTILAVDYTAVSNGTRGYTRSWISWVALDHEAVTADTTVAIDFATPVTRQQASGTLVLPLREASTLRTKGMGGVWATAWESLGSAGLGAATTMAVSTDGARLEYTVDWVEPASVQQPVTQYAITTSTSTSLVIRGGYPTGGELDATFLDIPLITKSPNPADGENLHGEITWEWYDADVWMRCFVDRDTTTLGWLVLAPPTETSLRIPRGPSSLDEATLLGDEWLSASCQAVEMNLTSDWVDRAASAPPFPLAR
jgi:hypothetical protein